jgi:UDP-N-acetylglucosamine acyltransferase
MTRIHPSARVHPTAILEGDVEIGPRSVISALCVLTGPLVIGEGVTLHPFCVLGSAPEHQREAGHGTVYVGDRSVLHPYCLVSRGTGARDTRIGEDCLLLDHVHVSHDCQLGDHVVAAQNVVLAGHVRVHGHVNLGVGAVLHQRSTVGAYAMLGMGSIVTKDVPPFITAAGNPARFMKLHARGLERAGVAFDAVRIEDEALASDHPLVHGALRAFEADVRDDRRVLSLRL